MTTVFDVADYVLKAVESTTSMKLQKLVYYSQAWSLAWDDTPLFDEDFQAWANGPVCVELFRKHKGVFKLNANFFEPYISEDLSDMQKESVSQVIEDYAFMAPHELSDLTHREYPWINARGNTPPGMPCDAIIEKEVMRDYYAGLIPVV